MPRVSSPDPVPPGRAWLDASTVEPPLISSTAYDAVRKNDDETMWLLLDYESDKSNALTLTATGTGDLADFASRLEPQRASFGYVRVKYVSGTGDLWDWGFWPERDGPCQEVEELQCSRTWKAEK